MVINELDDAAKLLWMRLPTDALQHRQKQCSTKESIEGEI